MAEAAIDVTPGLAPGETLVDVAARARHCRACPLWELGKQTVFGAGPADTRIVMIGEAPGEYEDREGVPFVGPAGRMLDRALAEIGLDRAQIYITNVVKHRPWVPAGNRKKNRAPKTSEIKACRPWLHAELELIRPPIVVCLGAPAAKEILGKEFRLTQQRGQWYSTPTIPNVLATLHPAYVLIQPPETMDAMRDLVFADLARVADRYRELTAATGRT
ncbi:MAG TPA: UdgX family uracil-DNA binding protein [Chloroflexota bacterium]|jgi:DNA polymerase